jgi:hypothetical protein
MQPFGSEYFIFQLKSENLEIKTYKLKVVVITIHASYSEGSEFESLPGNYSD